MGIASDALAPPIPQSPNLPVGAGGWVEIAVSDTGTGIPPEAQKAIFEPFYTTKAEDKGTGLGLPICRRIVQEHRGDISLESALGQGTTFRVRLPIAAEVAPGSP